MSKSTGKKKSAPAKRNPNERKAVRGRGRQKSQPSEKSPDSNEGRVKSFWGRCDWVFLGLIILFVVVIRIRLLSFPLERDEGEYSYLGQLIQQGIPPYSLAYNMKLPGTYFMYALIMSLFGQTTVGVHLGLMIVNCITIILVYKVGTRVIGSMAALIAAISYGLLSLGPSVYGFAGHATHFVVFWAMAGLWVLLFALEKNKTYLFFIAGILLSLAFIMKQPGVFFALFGGIQIVVDRLQAKTFSRKQMLWNLGIYMGGALLPLSVMVFYLYASGVFAKFWFFAFVYSLKYALKIPMSGAANVFLKNFPPIMDGFRLMWIFAALGFVSLFLHPRLRSNRILVALFALLSFLTVCPSFNFREHYFITFLPAVSLLIGIFIDYVYITLILVFRGIAPSSGNTLAGAIAVAVFLLGGAIGIWQQSGYYFREDPRSLCRTIYGANPFPESIEVAKFIQRNTAVTDKIVVLGSEPQIYFYSQRHSATGHIYTYGLMEIHNYALEMQKEMAEEIERSKPKFVVYVRVDSSWLPRPESQTYIFRWIDGFLGQDYSLVGIADIISGTNTVFRWNEEASNYIPQSQSYLLVFQRR
jgi:hypothetical protein